MVKKEVHIIGAGCSGLSLAKYLSMENYANAYQINVYGEKSKAFEKPNYWSFWSGEISPSIDQVIKKKWYQWQIINEECTVLHKTNKLPYCTINSRDWLTFCDFEDTNVDPKIPEPGPLVFDSRSPRMSSRGLSQEFVGQTVEVEKPVFDPQTVTLMDFRCDQSHGIHFIYILPFSSKYALIESTRISKSPCPSYFYKQSIETYLKEKLGCIEYKIMAEEYGKIPMGTLRKHDKRYLGIGSNGNCLRKSSGYAFNAIQQQTKYVASQISKGKKISKQAHIPTAFSWLETTLDSIFLEALIEHPNKAPEYFTRISKMLTGDEFASFMSGKTRLIHLLKVIFSLPKVPFLKAWLLTIKANSYFGNNNA